VGPDRAVGRLMAEPAPAAFVTYIFPEIRQRQLEVEELVPLGWRLCRSQFAGLLVIALLFGSIGLVPGWQELKGWTGALIRCAVVLLGLMGTLTSAIFLDAALRGQAISVGKAMRLGLGRWPAGLWTALIGWVIVAALTLCLLVPGIIWSLYYMFSQQVVALRGLHGKPALDYSKRLVVGRWWYVALTGFVIGLIVVIPGFIVTMLIKYLHVPTMLRLAAAPFLLVAAMFGQAVHLIWFLNVDAVRR